MLTTPLNTLHRELGAKMVPFAGYDMPVQFPEGIIQEHLHTRAAAGLFDVSHMGQLVISGATATSQLESLLPADLEGLPIDGQVYSLLTNDKGGVRDDLIVTRWQDNEYFLVVNAACKQADMAYLQKSLQGLEVTVLEEQALLALQGPAARAVISQLLPAAAELHFMLGCRGHIDGVEVYVTCSGYTGEDGFEISVPGAAADALARRLLKFDGVKPVGLGARDSLRLEAGLSLYGHELDEDTSPVEACLMWSIGQSRREHGLRAGGFPGADVIFELRERGSERKRVGLLVEGKRPVRAGQSVVDGSGNSVGVISSAGFGASLGGPIALAFVKTPNAALGSRLSVDVRGKLIPVTVVQTPFVPQRYFRG